MHVQHIRHVKPNILIINTIIINVIIIIVTIKDLLQFEQVSPELQRPKRLLSPPQTLPGP